MIRNSETLFIIINSIVNNEMRQISNDIVAIYENGTREWSELSTEMKRKRVEVMPADTIQSTTDLAQFHRSVKRVEGNVHSTNMRYQARN